MCTEAEAKASAKDPRFHSFTQLDSDIYEVKCSKQSICYDLPLHIGFSFTVTQSSSCSDSILSFSITSFRGVILPWSSVTQTRRIFPSVEKVYMTLSNQNCETNTNSVCMTGFHHHLFDEGGERSCCQQFSAFDKKTPGKLKLEFQGERMVYLCSKPYVICSENQTKRSAKDFHKNKTTWAFKTTWILCSRNKALRKKPIGFKLDSHHQLSTYQQCKRGLTFLYPKRKVLEDGISTIPLDL